VCFFLVAIGSSPHRRSAEKRAEAGCSVEEAELDNDEAEKVVAARLVHLPPSVPPTAAERGGAARAQKLAGVDGYGYREGYEEGDDVWEVAADGVSSMACSEGVFIGRSGLARGWPKVGVRRRATFNAGRGGLGSVLAR
jgi:hypothetical protein